MSDEPKTAADALIAQARESESGVMGALMTGRWPSGDPVGVCETATVHIWNGDDTSGPADAVVQLKRVNGELIVDEGEG